MNLKLKKFNMSSIKDDKVVIFIGKRETGKSFLVKDLLWHHKDMPVGKNLNKSEPEHELLPNSIYKLYFDLVKPIDNEDEFKNKFGQKIYSHLLTLCPMSLAVTIKLLNVAKLPPIG